MQQSKGVGVNRRIISVWLFLLPLAVVITMCGGGGGGGGTADTTSPSVTSTSPADGTTGVATDGVVNATFDERMDALTITTTTFAVRRGDSKVLGAVTYDAGTRTATFTPSSPFALMTRYIATITTGAKDVAGNSLSANYTWSFISRDGIWGTTALIETDNAGDAWSPQIAMDSSGNAIAVWEQSDGTRFNIWANRYMPGTGWGTAALIETDNAGEATDSDMAMDSSGNAIAVWGQSDGTRYNIWANRYVPGTGWGMAALLETDNAGDAWSPRIAMDSSGNAIAVWYQSDGTRYNIWANRYVPGTGWGTAELIETDNAGDAFNVEIAGDSSGNAVAVWRQSDGTRYNIWANRYVPGAGWGTAALIETDNSGAAATPQIAVDSAGNAIAVWQQSDGTHYKIWANRYVAGTGWGTAALIEIDNAGDAYYPQVAMDSSGNAIAVWYQSDGTRRNIWANRYLLGTGWGTAALIETDNAGDAEFPRVVTNSSGNAIAVWNQSDGTRDNIWANQFK